jgi:hypothetical protein
LLVFVSLIFLCIEQLLRYMTICGHFWPWCRYTRCNSDQWSLWFAETKAEKTRLKQVWLYPPLCSHKWELENSKARSSGRQLRTNRVDKSFCPLHCRYLRSMKLKTSSTTQLWAWGAIYQYLFPLLTTLLQLTSYLVWH